ncbi:hypothetical protein OJF2_03880 [Aquisphaera giovannonii]|uniref:Winged helix-turn helix domain-containing protein n=1 Tax=Aquisphaera giovannonii TaxID=406548 RepID=A0A5B9VVN7_9BACT|nr:helix-turn-helix domain-containing protein [Aquisphaera giovannonii]QEH31921.1 hypothetical protein OJF2_03880 [Aquisphaera giovannonii]
MSRWKLSRGQRDRLHRQLRSTRDARIYRRTLAVLELDRGRSAAEIAAMLGVSRQSVHNWAAAFARDPDPSTLRDADRSGRPALWAERTASLLPSLMGRSPQALGYPRPEWTIPLLRRQFEKELGLGPSDDTLRRSLRRLGYVWKRSRYVLAPGPGRPADPDEADRMRSPDGAGAAHRGGTGGVPDRRPGHPEGGSG